MSGALEGLVGADFGRVLAGPYATMLPADFGAEVVKIERPGTGDDTRRWEPLGGYGIHHPRQPYRLVLRRLPGRFRGGTTRCSAAGSACRPGVEDRQETPVQNVGGVGCRGGRIMG